MDEHENNRETLPEEVVSTAYPEWRHERRQQQSRSFFFPILLISLGVFFLLRNTGIVSVDVWATVVSLWPVLFIAIGLDSLFQRHGIVGPIFWITLGAVLLLANFNLLALDVITLLFNLWPLLLIAIGLDIVVGRRSLIGSLVATAVLLAILGGALWFLASGASPVSMQEIHESIDGATRGRILLSPAVGSVNVSAMEQEDGFVQGQVYTGRGESVFTNYSIDSNIARLSISSKGLFRLAPVGRQTSWSWDLQFTPELPLDIEVDMGAGDIYLDLRGLNVNRVEISQGMGRITMRLPKQGDFTVDIDGAMGECVLIVPKGISLWMRTDMAMVLRDLPEGYQQNGNETASPGYNPDGDAIRVQVNQAMGRFLVREE